MSDRLNPSGLGRHDGWRCEDCFYEWPLSRAPRRADECDNCGGAFEEVFEFGTKPLPELGKIEEVK